MDKKNDIKGYEDNLQILPANNATHIYRYLDAILKHMPKDALKTFEKLFYTVKKLYWQLIPIKYLIVLMMQT